MMLDMFYCYYYCYCYCYCYCYYHYCTSVELQQNAPNLAHPKPSHAIILPCINSPV